MKIKLDTNSDGIRIELIPLIDVVFCILIFFILAALQLTRQQAIDVDLPSAGTSTLQNQQMLMVSIDALGRLYVDRSGVSESQLYLILEGYRRTNPLGLMVLYADRNAIYDDVVQVLDLMRSVGGDRVALATLPPGTDAQDIELDVLQEELLLQEGLQEGLQESELPDNPLPDSQSDVQPDLQLWLDSDENP